MPQDGQLETPLGIIFWRLRGKRLGDRKTIDCTDAGLVAGCATVQVSEPDLLQRAHEAYALLAL